MKKGRKMSRVVPILRIFDETLARAFYMDYLGFEVLFEHRFEEDAPLYMGVQRKQCELHLSEHFGDATPGSSVRVQETDLAGYHGALSQKKLSTLSALCDRATLGVVGYDHFGSLWK
jgi:uncharacterized glyoxalase superfamily protein PhnB